MMIGAQIPSARSARQVVEAVAPRQHHVEDDRVVVDRRCAIRSALVAVAGDVDDEAFVAQAAPQRGRHPHVVLDDQHPHTTIVPLQLRGS